MKLIKNNRCRRQGGMAFNRRKWIVEIILGLSR